MKISRIKSAYAPKINQRKPLDNKNNLAYEQPSFKGKPPIKGSKLLIGALGLYSLVATLLVARPIQEKPTDAAEFTKPVQIEETRPQAEESNSSNETEIVLKPFLTADETEKLQKIKTVILDARKIKEDLNKDAWSNFNKFYDITKDKGAIYFDGPEDGFPLTESYEEYYKNYSKTSKIASGDTDFIQGSVKTGQDAVFFIDDILMEILNENGSHDEIDNGRHVNQGETEVLYTVLDTFDKMNPEVQAVSKIFREEFDKAKEEAQTKISLTGFEAKLERDENGEYAKYLTGKFDDIYADFEQMSDVKKDYNKLKGKITDPKSISDETFTNLYYMNLTCDEAFSRICETCLLDETYEDPNIAIDTRSLEDASYKAHARFYGLDAKG